MALPLILTGVALFLAIGVFAAVRSRAPDATVRVYAASGVLSAILLLLALRHLLFAGAAAPGVVLPLGLPWMGAHFRLDALSAFFLAVINLGGAAASLYGLGYGRHEQVPERVLPFFPAFLAGMNLVVVAADAFAFLLSWEFMSLASWALVMARHRDPTTPTPATSIS
jgi:hydrogenase-4 component B